MTRATVEWRWQRRSANNLACLDAGLTLSPAWRQGEESRRRRSVAFENSREKSLEKKPAPVFEQNKLLQELRRLARFSRLEFLGGTPTQVNACPHGLLPLELSSSPAQGCPHKSQTAKCSTIKSSTFPSRCSRRTLQVRCGSPSTKWRARPPLQFIYAQCMHSPAGSTAADRIARARARPPAQLICFM